MNDFLEFVDTLPEAHLAKLLSVLSEFLDAVRRATEIAEVNIAAGIALERLSA